MLKRRLRWFKQPSYLIFSDRNKRTIRHKRFSGQTSGPKTDLHLWLGMVVNNSEKFILEFTTTNDQKPPHLTEYDPIGSHRRRSAQRFGRP